MRATPTLMMMMVTAALACGDKEAGDDTAGEDTASDAETDDDGDTDGDGGTGTDPVDADGDGTLSDADCDDDDPAAHPGATELCDGVDNDCDGDIDEEDAADAGTWYADDDDDGAGDAARAVQACMAPAGHVAAGDDCDDTDAGVHPGADEVCDAADNDCDGTIDEDDAVDAPIWFADLDGDAHGDPDTATPSCDPPFDHVIDGSDCDDSRSSTNPGAAELCDTIDNDCDGTIDEDDAADAAIWYADADDDGFGDPSATRAACAAPSGHVDDANDCDDTDIDINPDATEVCDTVDNDCDGTTDEDDATDAPTWYADVDSDGFGDPTSSTLSCAQPSGHVAVDTDCDDTDIDINPDAAELCDTIDNDCDGTTDEDDATDASTWYADADSDGFGDASTTSVSCAQPSGTVAVDTDCDDTDIDINPDATELCDTIDNDCDGTTDEDDATDAPTWYADADSDGRGDPASTTTACSQPSGYVDDTEDCDDADPAISPDASELCDAVDNDCDGTIDEDDATDAPTWYADLDGDGWGVDTSSIVACRQPAGHEADGGDCDDDDVWTHPSATELCDGLQNDCDDTGWTDDAGIASVEDDAGDWSDATATLAAGTTGSVATLSLTDETLHVCEGTWLVSVDLTGSGGITGHGDRANIILDGDDTDRLFTSSGDEVHLRTLTLTRGYSSNAGGAVKLTSAGDVSISDVYIGQSEADKGGAIHAYNLDSLDLDTVTIDGNVATSGYGGGLNIWDVTAFTFDGLTITNNENTSSYGGGGMATYGSVDTVGLDLTLEGNEAAGYGGGWAIIGGTHAVADFLIHDNATSGGGGGIDTTASLMLESGTFSDNEGNYGGALRVKGGSTLFEADNVIFDSNIANHTGAGIHFASSADAIIDTCEFVDNVSPSGKPTLNNSGDTIEIIDSDFSGSADYDMKSGGTSYLWETVAVGVLCDSTGCS
jgi:hypothetical protein